MLHIDKDTPLTVFTERERFSPTGGLAARLVNDTGSAGIKVTVPGGPEKISQWSLLTVRFGREGAKYMFCAQVVEADGEDFTLRPTTGVMRAQRRGDIRLEILREITAVTEDGDTEFKGIIMDISAGGMSMRTDIPLKQGDKFNITIPSVAGVPPVAVDCEVRWSMHQPGDPPYAYQTGCLFKFPYRVDKERLLKYINRVQRNRLHKFDN